MKVTTGRIIKMIIGPKIHGDVPPKPEDLEKDMNEFTVRILPRLESQLKEHSFIVSNELTVVDLVYYNEIRTIVQLTGREINESKFPSLPLWYEKISKMPEVAETDKMLDQIINQFNLNK